MKIPSLWKSRPPDFKIGRFYSFPSFFSFLLTLQTCLSPLWGCLPRTGGQPGPLAGSCVALLMKADLSACKSGCRGARGGGGRALVGGGCSGEGLRCLLSQLPELWAQSDPPKAPQLSAPKFFYLSALGAQMHPKLLHPNLPSKSWRRRAVCVKLEQPGWIMEWRREQGKSNSWSLGVQSTVP